MALCLLTWVIFNLERLQTNLKWVILNKETIVTIIPETACCFSGTHSADIFFFFFPR